MLSRVSLNVRLFASSRYMVEIKGTFFFFIFGRCRSSVGGGDCSVRGVKAEGGVPHERPLRRGPCWSTHLKLLEYKVTRAARRGYCPAIRNPKGEEAGRTVNGPQR